MTIGQLKDVFLDIKNQNRADSVIGEVLERINRDRIGVAHHKAKASTEANLRKNVGQHVWSIIAALYASLGIGRR